MPRKSHLTRKKNPKKRKDALSTTTEVISSQLLLSDDNLQVSTDSHSYDQTPTSDHDHVHWYQQQTGNDLFLWKIGFSHPHSGDEMPCFITQAIIVDVLSGSWRVWVNGKQVSTSTCDVLEKVPEKVDGPNVLLEAIDGAKVCPGNTKRELVEYASSIKALSGFVQRNYGQAIATVRHERCEQLMGQGRQTRCKCCNLLRVRLSVQLFRRKRRKQQQCYSKFTPNRHLNTPQKMDKLKGLSHSLKVSQQELSTKSRHR